MKEELYTAISNAIAAMGDPKKNRENSHYKNRYADLGAVLDCIEGPLRDNGLLLLQIPEVPDRASDKAFLLVRLIHIKSGEDLEFAYPLILTKNDPQAMGTAISYARRYTIKSLFGMFDEDDDGNRSSRPQTKAPVKQAKKQTPTNDWATVEEAVLAMATAKDIKTLNGIAMQAKATFTGESDTEQLREAYMETRDQLMAPTEHEQG